MPSLRHGTKSGYEGGCRCDRCRAWNREKQAKYRAAKRGEKPPAKRAAVARKSAGSTSTPKRILGPVERSLTEQLEQADAPETPWSGPLKAAALALARALDGADSTLAPRIYPQLLDALERLGMPAGSKIAPPHPQDGPQPVVADPGAPDDVSHALAGIRIQGGGGAAVRDTA